MCREWDDVLGLFSAGGNRDDRGQAFIYREVTWRSTRVQARVQSPTLVEYHELNSMDAKAGNSSLSADGQKDASFAIFVFFSAPSRPLQERDECRRR